MKQKTVTLGVKLWESEAAVFQKWCKMRGMTPNEALSYIIECIIKFQNKDSITNSKIFEVMEVWDMNRDMSKVGSVIYPGSELNVVQCLYFIQPKEKSDTLCVLVKPTFFTEVNYSTNNNEIIDHVMKSTISGIYKRINKACKRLGAIDIIDGLKRLVDFFYNNYDEIEEDIFSEFNDNSRHEYGRNIEYNKYVKHNKKNIDESHQLSLFNEQGQELPEDNREREMADDGQEDEADGEL